MSVSKGVHRLKYTNYGKSAGQTLTIKFTDNSNKSFTNSSEVQRFYVWAVKDYEPNHPLNAAFKGEGFKVRDEIYRQKRLSPVENRRILLALDLNDPATRNAKGAMESDRDMPVSWIKDYGKGRVFFCGLGHNNEIFFNPAILRHELDGIQFALGDLKVDATPVKEGK